MKKLFATLIFCLIVSPAIAQKFLPNHPLESTFWLGNKISHICEVKTDYRMYHEAYDSGSDTPAWVNTIYLKKGKFVGNTKHADNNSKWFINDAVQFPETSTRSDKIRYSAVLDKLTNQQLFDCQKNRIKRKKIEFDSFNIFTQNDLFNGTEDNEKIKAYGYLETPQFRQCKNIKKFPVMFLVHHAGGQIFPSYKWKLHQMCVATFEPYVFKSRGHDRNYNDPDAEIQWITETQGAVDVLQALDTIAELPNVDKERIGIMGWSYGGVVTVESQNMFNIKALGTKNRFAFHLAYYPYCYHYDDTDTTSGALVIMKGDKDTISYSQCQEWVERISQKKDNKQLIIYKNATHNFDADGMEVGRVAFVGPDCRIHTDIDGIETVRPQDKTQWFDLTANGGWFGDKGDPKKHKAAMKLCWDRDQAVYRPDEDAYKQSYKIFIQYVTQYLGGI